MSVVYRVGSLYHPDRTSWETTPHLRFEGGMIELLICVPHPTVSEIASVNSGVIQFAWVGGEHLGLLAFKAGAGFPWADCPYTPHLAGDYTKPDKAGTGQHQPVLVVLLDGATGIIRALRIISWPPRFVDSVVATVERLHSAPTNLAAHDAAIAAIYQRYPTPAALVKQRADVRCTGGTSHVFPGGGLDSWGYEKLEDRA